MSRVLHLNQTLYSLPQRPDGKRIHYQSSLIPSFIYYLDVSTYDLAWAAWYSLCATARCVSVYATPEACNKVSM